jgi:hypothetical protein
MKGWPDWRRAQIALYSARVVVDKMVVWVVCQTRKRMQWMAWEWG